MKKLTFIAALLVANTAFAQSALSPAQVSKECIRQMSLGICTVRPDRTKILPGETMHIAGVRDVPMTAVADYMDLYDETNPTNPAMCELALQYMTTEPGGDHDVIARALWAPIPYEDMESYLQRTNYEEQVKRWTAGIAMALVACAAAFGWRSKSINK